MSTKRILLPRVTGSEFKDCRARYTSRYNHAAMKSSPYFSYSQCPWWLLRSLKPADYGCPKHHIPSQYTSKVTTGDQGVKVRQYSRDWGINGKHTLWVSCRDLGAEDDLACLPFPLQCNAAKYRFVVEGERSLHFVAIYNQHDLSMR